ncbi:AbrB/MazE/SpoVT family DNA-binding domain-containing protein [Sphingomonas canadensis]|uniref:AbrB/MazE/SpoVT family DNA-binding domain-containing protein n=1 Tax=Sphingomonas canadensis TaxID=1219257 RepID=A0ABW3H594_9SPHN|nr:AbrB/MazE/SpoVT family DNA-binding domain-containing protein [Sphingomonas canadensis]MCW3836558.1 AbrB/MazE/SpoVT family DNA-binding domain-containing protein [Sphingomonas canadensis]
MNKPAKLGRVHALKVVRVGNSAGVILPKEVLAKLRVALGDELSISEVPGGIALTRHDPGFEEQMKTAREVMARRRNALRELAK